MTARDVVENYSCHLHQFTGHELVRIRFENNILCLDWLDPEIRNSLF